MRNPIKNAWNALLHKPKHLVFAIFRRVPWIICNDERYIKLYYWLDTDLYLNLDNPSTFNDKLNWLKLHNRRPEYTTMVDKYAVKQYVSSIIGSEYVIPTLGSWETPNLIQWNELPDQFVLKTNHDGGSNGIVVCKDIHKLNKSKAIKELWHSLHRNSFMIAREWPYKNVQKCIFAEKYMEDPETGELRDYKFFCFNGVVKLLYVATGRGTNERVCFNYFDEEFNPLNIKNGHPISTQHIAKPKSFELMKELAAKLSKGFPYLRVDFYEVEGHPYFGEFTFYHLGGTGIFEPDEWNKQLGDWIELPDIQK